MAHPGPPAIAACVSFEGAPGATIQAALAPLFAIGSGRAVGTSTSASVLPERLPLKPFPHCHLESSCSFGGIAISRIRVIRDASGSRHDLYW